MKRNVQIPTKTIIAQVLPVLLFIAYEQSMSLLYGSRPPIYPLIILYSFDIAFYCLVLICLRFALTSPYRIVSAICVCLLFVWLYIPVRYLADAAMNYGHTPATALQLKKSHTSLYAIRGTWLTGFAAITAFYQDGVNRMKALVAAEIARLNATAEQQRLQNAYLKAQLRPHLIFTTLNFIYHAVMDVSEKSARAVTLLAEMMRYALKEPGSDGLVSLEEELEHLENYIQLVRTTADGELYLDYELNGFPASTSQKVLPYMLLTFAENVFKHGQLNDPAAPARIKINNQDGLLCLHTYNHKTREQRPASTGIGIRNIRTRMETQYAGRFSLTISETPFIYELTLVIRL